MLYFGNNHAVYNVCGRVVLICPFFNTWVYCLPSVNYDNTCFMVSWIPIFVPMATIKMAEQSESNTIYKMQEGIKKILHTIFFINHEVILGVII